MVVGESSVAVVIRVAVTVFVDTGGAKNEDGDEEEEVLAERSTPVSLVEAVGGEAA